MRDPSEELSVRLGSGLDGSVGRPAGSKLRSNSGVGRGSNRTGHNASECRAGQRQGFALRLESEVAVAEPPTNGRRPMRKGRETGLPLPAAGVVAMARMEGSLRNVRGPIDCPQGQRRPGRRIGRESDRPIVPVRRVMTAEGRGLTSGEGGKPSSVLERKTMITGDWR